MNMSFQYVDAVKTAIVFINAASAGFSTYLKNLPRICYLFPKNRVTSMFIVNIPLWIYTVIPRLQNKSKISRRHR